MAHRRQKQVSLYDEELELLDEFEAEADSNRSEVIRELIAAADEARDRTGIEDPHDALEEILRAYPDTARSGGYDPDEFEGKLSEEQVYEMCESEKVPAIVPKHVSRRSVPDDTWLKMGLCAGMVRRTFSSRRILATYHDEDDYDVDSIQPGEVTKYIRRFAGGRSSVKAEDVIWRAAISLNEVEKLGKKVDAFYVKHEDWFDKADGPSSDEWQELQMYIKMGEEVVDAMREDGDERLSEVKEMLDDMREAMAEINEERMEQIDEAEVAGE